MTPEQAAQHIRELEFKLHKADYGMGMPRDYNEVLRLTVMLNEARLIAAAPDMLNALRDIVDCAQSEGRLFAAVVQNARDAIAKAEGAS